MRAAAIVLLLCAALASASLQTYDYIVVGGGNAGAAVAGLLAIVSAETHNPVKVLILEQGASAVDDHTDPDIEFIKYAPREVFETWNNPTMTYQFNTVANVPSYNRRLQILLARGLGGTTNINVGVWGRPYDGWYNSLNLAYFNDESFNAAFAAVENIQETGFSHGNNPQGFVPLSYGQDQTDLEETLTVLQNLGFTQVTDGTVGQTSSGKAAWRSLIALSNGVRASSSDIFLTAAEILGNKVYTITDATVTRVLMDLNDKTWVRGVEYVGSDGKTHRVYCNNEVILSAGVFGTPKILLQSGIGPMADLTALGITTVSDNSDVGQNLGMRPSVVFGVSYGDVADESNPALLYSNATITAWETTQTGLFGVPGSAIWGHDLTKNFMIEWTSATPLFAAPSGTRVFSCHVAQPQSTGSVTLKSKNPLLPPVVTSNMLSNQADLGALIACYSTVSQVITVAQSLPATWTETVPGLGLSDPEAIGQYISAAHIYGHHAVGTAAIGKAIGQDLLVNGFKNLRVLDGSALPQLPPTGIMATLYAMAFIAVTQIILPQFTTTYIPLNLPFNRGFTVDVNNMPYVVIQDLLSFQDAKLACIEIGQYNGGSLFTSAGSDQCNTDQRVVSAMQEAGITTAWINPSCTLVTLAGATLSYQAATDCTAQHASICVIANP